MKVFNTFLAFLTTMFFFSSCTSSRKANTSDDITINHHAAIDSMHLIQQEYEILYGENSSKLMLKNDEIANLTQLNTTLQSLFFECDSMWQIEQHSRLKIKSKSPSFKCFYFDIGKSSIFIDSLQFDNLLNIANSLNEHNDLIAITGSTDAQECTNGENNECNWFLSYQRAFWLMTELNRLGVDMSRFRLNCSNYYNEQLFWNENGDDRFKRRAFISKMDF
jgi:flagellar motor protein MotB